MEIKEQAHAKINLGLEVLSKRPDGYHDVHMVMQSLALCDEVTIRKRADGLIKVCTSKEELKDDQTNLAYKAAQAFRTFVGKNYGVEISIDKKIPMAAGLAGGSADAAAVLRGMNRLFGEKLTDRELCDVGVTIGADVPFCIIEHTAIAEGIGEKLTPLPMKLNCSILLVKPYFGVSTKAVYEAFDSSDGNKVNIQGIVDGIHNQDWNECFAAMGNDLESVTIGLYPKVGEIKEELKACGADYVLMSGSGPTVFAVFLDDMICQKAYESMKKLPYEKIVEKTSFMLADE
ncbi:4-(cytidine 5'-diphospho)-2-C-methyl-D-erythritol kinase [Eubacterium oxidoreducens]|nr:4-(cytidine 5'-diphospho)-2-C-methyl-D-erythritol kinase [Eubacterium oxidoreducens]